MADLFDIVSKQYVAKGIKTNGAFEIQADQASVVVVLPAGTKLVVKGHYMVTENGNIIAYQ